jgi:hypothetical protein
MRSVSYINEAFEITLLSLSTRSKLSVVFFGPTVNAELVPKFHFAFHISRDSSVGIASSYGLDDRGVGVRVPVGSRLFSSPRRPDGARPTYAIITGGSFLGGKAARA